MKNSTLLFRSILVIAVIAGSAHLATYASQENNTVEVYDENSSEEIISENSISNEEKPSENTSKNYNENTDYIIGKWKVTYNDKNFKGAIVYNIKKVGKTFNAYTYQYQDEAGNSQKAENAKILTIKNFDGYKGKGVYEIEYEKQKYQVECDINMVDENTFKLSYDYYGYSDVETWKRQ